MKVTTFDPWADPKEVKHEYGVESVKVKPDEQFDAVVLGVAHKEFRQMDLQQFCKTQSVIYDVKGVLSDNVDGRL